MTLALAAGGPGAFQLVALLLIGALAGVLGGALGIGGGLVMIPALVLVFGTRLYGVNSFHLFKLAALATAVVLSVPAVCQHARAGAIVRSMIPGIVVFALLGVALGVLGASWFTDSHTKTLRHVFGGFMLLAVAAKLWQARLGPDGPYTPGAACPVAGRRWRTGAIVGLPAGLIGGLLGVGGGIWAVPAQSCILHIRLPSAIANSACMIIALAAAGAILQAFAVDHMTGISVGQGLWLALWLAPGAVAGGWFGGRLAHRLPIGWLRAVFYLLLAITGARLMLY